MDNKEWLKKTRIRYAPDTSAYHKTWAFIVTPTKRFLRKLFTFIGVPLIEEINEYHRRLILEMESQWRSLQEEQDALSAERAEYQREMAVLHTTISEYQHETAILRASFSALDKKYTESNVLLHNLNDWVTLNARILESIVLERHKRRYGVIDDTLIPQKRFESSLACRADMISYVDWLRQMGIDDTVMHRKYWEWLYIAQVLFERGALTPGKKGLGFAVGSEPLPALFARYGVDIMATDLEAENPEAKNWKVGNQHADDLSALEHPFVCDRETFYKNVHFMPLDMNNIPGSLNGFDFCWSSCAFEHLGSEEHGRAFILNTLNVLNPGGVSVHTTEFNLSTDYSVETPAGTVYGKDFFTSLRDEIAAKGHYFAPIDYRIGNHQDDDYIFRFEDCWNAHLKLRLGHCVSTSIGFVIIKKPRS